MAKRIHKSDLAARVYRLYRSKAWRGPGGVRAQVLTRDKRTCVFCLREERLVPANEVHHIERLGTASGWRNRLNPDACVSLCEECHARCTRIERAGNRHAAAPPRVLEDGRPNPAYLAWRDRRYRPAGAR